MQRSRGRAVEFGEKVGGEGVRGRGGSHTSQRLRSVRESGEGRQPERKGSESVAVPTQRKRNG